MTALDALGSNRPLQTEEFARRAHDYTLNPSRNRLKEVLDRFVDGFGAVEHEPVRFEPVIGPQCAIGLADGAIVIEEEPNAGQILCDPAGLFIVGIDSDAEKTAVFIIEE